MRSILGGESAELVGTGDRGLVGSCKKSGIVGIYCTSNLKYKNGCFQMNKNESHVYFLVVKSGVCKFSLAGRI